jgi:EAL and modified HD-GYP domain-containing signal transduction protein
MRWDGSGNPPKKDNDMSEHPHPPKIVIGRRPIFDDRRRLWGYEVFCVSDSALPVAADRMAETIQVASGAFIALQQVIAKNKKIILNFTERGVLDNLPHALPAKVGAVKIKASAGAGSGLAEELELLKKAGYQIVVEGLDPGPEAEALYRLADVIWLEWDPTSDGVPSAALASLKKFTAARLAGRVRDAAQFQTCKELGFTLFEGAFFKAPEIVTLRKLSSNQVARFNLLALIQQEEPDQHKLAEQIQADASVSYRLLTYLNSASFGLRHKINSIGHAISLLGWQKIKSWLRVILMADVDQSPAAGELFFVSAQRGKFLELIAETHTYWGFDPESLHLLGLFSLLDTMLGIPMPEVVSYLPLDNKIKHALCREPNNEYLPLLHLAQCFEEGRWAEAEAMMQRLNLDPVKSREAFQTAIQWAAELSSVADGQGK